MKRKFGILYTSAPSVPIEQRKTTNYPRQEFHLPSLLPCEADSNHLLHSSHFYLLRPDKQYFRARQISIEQQMKFIAHFGDDIRFDMAKFLEPLQKKLVEIEIKLKEIDDKVDSDAKLSTQTLNAEP